MMQQSTAAATYPTQSATATATFGIGILIDNDVLGGRDPVQAAPTRGGPEDLNGAWYPLGFGLWLEAVRQQFVVRTPE